MTTGGTPTPVIERLEAEVRNIVAMPEVGVAFEKLGMNMRCSGARDFADHFDREIKRWAAVVRFSGAHAD